ncbi:hypothetical protein DPMN_108751 [Dreissena polymorpha]|uniref:Myb/SANT-like DNA-binding domain-containing protein n=2 Tax=Dreissena polymorpha TaxID=45954 RepID=A0A9D4K9F1_DREPO|nr:hypothetical protein DPMN_108751 [Dreissena polymorpha]
MAHKGVTVTGEACDSKFRLIKFKYKKIVDQHATSGSGRKNWEYFQRMDELFAGDPSVRPAMVVSSMPVQQDVTVTVTAKPPPGPRRPTVHKAPTPPQLTSQQEGQPPLLQRGLMSLLLPLSSEKEKEVGAKTLQNGSGATCYNIRKDLTAWMPITSV